MTSVDEISSVDVKEEEKSVPSIDKISSVDVKEEEKSVLSIDKTNEGETPVASIDKIKEETHVSSIEKIKEETSVTESDSGQNRTLEDVKSKVEYLKVENNHTNHNINETDKQKAESEQSPLSPSELQERIIFQIEYYFSDVNLLKDKFMREEMAKNDGWIPLSIFSKFKRMAKLSTDVPTIVAALKNSKRNLLDISEDEQRVRRKPELKVPEYNDWIETSRPRTVFVGGFPSDGSVTLDMILDFFLGVCKFEGIVPRTSGHPAKFKGSVLVIFPTIEEANDFLKLDDLMYKDTVLRKEFQCQHFERKRKMIEDKKKEKLESREKEMAQSKPLPKGALIHITGIPADTGRGELLDILLKKGLTDYAFIEYTQGDSEAYIRLKKENTSEEVIAKNFSDKVCVKDQELNFTTVTGEEEETKLKQMFEEKFVNARKFTGYKRRKNNKYGKTGPR